MLLKQMHCGNHKLIRWHYVIHDCIDALQLHMKSICSCNAEMQQQQLSHDSVGIMCASS